MDGTRRRGEAAPDRDRDGGTANHCRRASVVSQRLEGERAGDARLAMVHVSSHSRQRHKVMTVIVFASVSTRLPWQNGHAVGRLTTSLNRDSDIVGVSILPSSRYAHCSLVHTRGRTTASVPGLSRRDRRLRVQQRTAGRHPAPSRRVDLATLGTIRDRSGLSSRASVSSLTRKYVATLESSRQRAMQHRRAALILSRSRALTGALHEHRARVCNRN